MSNLVSIGFVSNVTIISGACNINKNPYLVPYFVDILTKVARDPLAISSLLRETSILPGNTDGQDSNKNNYRFEFTEFTNTFQVEAGNKSQQYILISANYNMQYPTMCYFLFQPSSGIGIISCHGDIIKDDNHQDSLVKIFERYLKPLTIATQNKLEDSYALLRSWTPGKVYWDTSVIPHLGHYIMNDLAFAVRLFPKLLTTSSPCILARVDNGFIDYTDELRIIIPCSLSAGKIQHFKSRSELLNSVRKERAALISIYDATVTTNLAESVGFHLTATDIQPVAKQDLSSFNFVIGIGLRGGTRQALNLDDLLCILQQRLYARGLRVCYVFDGLADSINNSISTTKDLNVDLEAQIAAKLSLKLRHLNAYCTSVVGWKLVDQLQILKNCNLILAHQGSSSVKYSYLLSKPVLLHGPIKARTNRSKISTRPVGIDFMSAYRGKPAPIEIFLPPECIEVEGHSLSENKLSRKQLFRANYRINTKLATDNLLRIIDCILMDSGPASYYDLST